MWNQVCRDILSIILIILIAKEQAYKRGANYKITRRDRRSVSYISETCRCTGAQEALANRAKPDH